MMMMLIIKDLIEIILKIIGMRIKVASYAPRCVAVAVADADGPNIERCKIIATETDEQNH